MIQSLECGTSQKYRSFVDSIKYNCPSNIERPNSLRYHIMKSLSLILLIALQVGYASLNSLDKLVQSNDQSSCNNLSENQSEKLLLVNILNRHGDRAPTGLKNFDRHSEKVQFFWPKGYGQLTSTGWRRMYNLGVALRRHYNKNFLLNYDPKSILALTSNVPRCVESQQATLQGFYDLTTNVDDVWEQARKFRHHNTSTIPSGQGSSSVWNFVHQDRTLVPSLDYTYFANSRYARHHPSPLRKSLMNDPQIAKVENIDALRSLMANHYKEPFAFSISSIWASIQIELNIYRTDETLGYMDHFANWIDDVVKEDENQRVNLYNLFEEVVLLTFVGMADKNSDYLVVSPIINSILESQSVALGEKPENERSKRYLGKNIIFYSTHDSILTMMLNDLGALTIDGSTWADRLLAAKAKGASDMEKFLDGVAMCKMGLSLKFELWSITSGCKDNEHTNSIDEERSPIVRLSIYNEQDPYAPVDWKPVRLGSFCRRRYAQLFENGKQTDPLDEYYANKSNNLKLNQDFDCPFELFKKITSPWILNETLYRKIYNDDL